MNFIGSKNRSLKYQRFTQLVFKEIENGTIVANTPLVILKHFDYKQEKQIMYFNMLILKNTRHQNMEALSCFATNSDFIIPLSSAPNVVDL